MSFNQLFDVIALNLGYVLLWVVIFGAITAVVWLLIKAARKRKR
jgi:hypothetical protein